MNSKYDSANTQQLRVAGGVMCRIIAVLALIHSSSENFSLKKKELARVKSSGAGLETLLRLKT